jgi:hypothetical protein
MSLQQENPTTFKMFLIWLYLQTDTPEDQYPDPKLLALIKPLLDAGAFPSPLQTTVIYKNDMATQHHFLHVMLAFLDLISFANRFLLTQLGLDAMTAILRYCARWTVIRK